MLTKRQKQALDFITSFEKKKGFSPSLEEIKEGRKQISKKKSSERSEKLLGLLKHRQK